MNKEEILSTVAEIVTETKVKAWMFQVEKNYYQVLEYGGVYRVPPSTGIWECNKRGKRGAGKPIFSIDGKNIERCIDEFLDSIIEAKTETVE
jgi:hypothetical protein